MKTVFFLLFTKLTIQIIPACEKGYCTAFKNVEYLGTYFLLKVHGEDAFLHPETGFDVCEEQGEWGDGG